MRLVYVKYLPAKGDECTSDRSCIQGVSVPYYSYSRYVNITNQTVKKELDKALAALSLFQHPWYNRMNFYLTNNTVLKDLASINMTDFMIKVNKPIS